MLDFYFKKYHGLGNDFVMIDGISSILPIDLLNIKPNVVKHICNRNFGIGSDGLIFALPSDKYDFKMCYYNSDGSKGEMCGNGLRCLIRFILDSGVHLNKDTFSIETLAGEIKAKVISENIEVNMGKPIFIPSSIPTKLKVNKLGIPYDQITIEGNKLSVYSAGMGNPHAIVIVDNLEEVKLDIWGPFIENSPLFPSKTNVHFVMIVNKQHIKLLVWERGCGPTLSCGTGACASLATLSLLGMINPRAKVTLPGGDLEVSWPNKTGDIFMTGPATFVYEGKFTL